MLSQTGGGIPPVFIGADPRVQGFCFSSYNKVDGKKDGWNMPCDGLRQRQLETGERIATIYQVGDTGKEDGSPGS